MESWKIVASVILLVLASICIAYLALSYFMLKQAETSKICIVDIANRTVCVGTRVERVVSLFPEATRMIIAIGASEKLVGVSTDDTRDPLMTRIYPKLKQLPALGRATEPNYEEIAKLKPDVIFADAQQVSALEEIQSKTGIPVVGIRVSVNRGNVSGVFTYDGFEIIGKVLGKEYEERGRYLVHYLESKLDMVRSRVAVIPPEKRLKVYITFAQSPLTTNGHADPALSAGLINVAYSGRIWYPVGLEQVIKWDPDIIALHAYSGRMGNYTIETLLKDPNWRLVRAVREGKVYNIIVGLYGWYPDMSVINVMQLAKIAYPEFFKDLDIEKEGNEIYNTLYGIDNFFTKIAKELNLYIP